MMFPPSFVGVGCCIGSKCNQYYQGGEAGEDGFIISGGR